MRRSAVRIRLQACLFYFLTYPLFFTKKHVYTGKPTYHLPELSIGFQTTYHAHDDEHRVGGPPHASVGDHTACGTKSFTDHARATLVGWRALLGKIFACCLLVGFGHIWAPRTGPSSRPKATHKHPQSTPSTQPPHTDPLKIVSDTVHIITTHYTQNHSPPQNFYFVAFTKDVHRVVPQFPESRQFLKKQKNHSKTMFGVISNLQTTFFFDYGSSVSPSG